MLFSILNKDQGKLHRQYLTACIAGIAKQGLQHPQSIENQ